MSLIGNIITIVLIVLVVMTAITEPMLSMKYGEALVKSSFKAGKWIYDFFKNGDYSGENRNSDELNEVKENG